MGRVKIIAEIISPEIFKKYLLGIGPSNLTIKAKKTEKEIKIMSANKNKNFLLGIKFPKAIYYVFYLRIG